MYRGDLKDIFSSNEYESLENSNNNIAFIGTVGSGKTSLVNKLCNTDYITSDSWYSCTRKIQYGPSASNDMVFLDFPGLCSSKDIASHLRVLELGLRFIPLKAIGICVAYEKRIDIMLKFINYAFNIMKHHSKNLFIIITHCDGIKEEILQKTYGEISKKFQINKIIFTDINTQEKFISDKIYSFTKDMINLKSKIVQNCEIFKQNDLDIEYEFQNYHNKYFDLYKKIFEQVKIEISLNDDKELQRAFYFFLTDYKDKLSLELVKELLNSFDVTNSNVPGDDSYDDARFNVAITLQICFIKSITDLISKFKLKVENDLEIQCVNYKNNSNQFRQCIYCEEIWFRVYGCDSIVCGNRPGSKTDDLNGVYHNYTINVDEKRMKFKIIKNTTKIEKKIENEEGFFSRLLNNIIGSNSKSEDKNEKNIKPIGCGRQMDWLKMKDVTDKVKEELKNISTTQDYHAVHSFIENLKL